MSRPEVALIVGGGQGISASCAKLFVREGMQVAVAARTPNKPALTALEKDYGVLTFACDASDPDAVAQLFETVNTQLGPPTLVVHNIDGRNPEIFRKTITEADPKHVLSTIMNSTFSAFLVGQQAARWMLDNPMTPTGRGTILFTNASAALKGFALSGAFAAASQGKAGLAQSMARELMPQGIHVVTVPIDAAIGVPQADGSRAHWLAGTTDDDNMADPDRIAEAYWYLHRQHKSTWSHELVVRPWVEQW